MYSRFWHPSFKPKSSLHFRDFAFSQRNWKLEIRKKHINSGVLSNFQFRISSFSIRFPDSTSDFQPENIPHFREKCKLMDEGCLYFLSIFFRVQNTIQVCLRQFRFLSRPPARKMRRENPFVEETLDPKQFLRFALLQIDSYLIGLFFEAPADFKAHFFGQFHHLTVLG